MRPPPAAAVRVSRRFLVVVRHVDFLRVLCAERPYLTRGEEAAGGGVFFRGCGRARGVRGGGAVTLLRPLPSLKVDCGRAGRGVRARMGVCGFVVQVTSACGGGAL